MRYIPGFSAVFFVLCELRRLAVRVRSTLLFLPSLSVSGPFCGRPLVRWPLFSAPPVGLQTLRVHKFLCVVLLLGFMTTLLLLSLPTRLV